MQNFPGFSFLQEMAGGVGHEMNACAFLFYTFLS